MLENVCGVVIMAEPTLDFIKVAPVIRWEMRSYEVDSLLQDGDILMRRTPTQLILNLRQYRRMKEKGWEVVRGSPDLLS